MLIIKQWWRSLVIILLMLRFGLRPTVCAPISLWLEVISYLNPYSWSPKQAARAVLLRRLLERLGPLFIKLGQQLSTRRDLLPADIAAEMILLQDRVPAFPGEIAKESIEQALAAPINELFASFDMQPLASASIAQVHAAQLHDGREVIVKVLRPKIRRLIKRDIRLMYMAARIISKLTSHSKRLRLVEVVAEYEATTLDELDLQREAANAATLRRNFADSDLMYVPEIYWPYVRRSILVQERIYGIPINQVQRLREAGADLSQLATDGVEIFFTQVFRDSFFHADMHAGNIFVGLPGGKKAAVIDNVDNISFENSTENDSADNANAKATAPWKYIGVDFGIMGSLTPCDQYYLAENLLAFFNRDYRRVAELHINSGWVSADTRVDRFEAAIRTVCEPIFELPLEKISFAQVLLRLFQTAARFNMTVQPQLILLQKTLVNVEGLGRDLYPQLNLWDCAKPHLEKFVRAKRGPLAVAMQIARRLPQAVDSASQMPELALQALSFARDYFNAGPAADSCSAIKNPVKNSFSRLRVSLISSGLVLLVISLFYGSQQHFDRYYYDVRRQAMHLFYHHGMVVSLLIVLFAWLWPRKPKRKST